IYILLLHPGPQGFLISGQGTQLLLLYTTTSWTQSFHYPGPSGVRMTIPTWPPPSPRLTNAAVFQMCLPSAPCGMDVSGQFDVEFRITVACRNGHIYIPAPSTVITKVLRWNCRLRAVGLFRVGKNCGVGAQRPDAPGFTQKGSVCGVLPLPAPVTAMAPMRLRLVAQWRPGGDGERRAEAVPDQFTVSSLRTPEPVTAVTFGRYGREEGTVVMATAAGRFSCLWIRRCVSERETCSGSLHAATAFSRALEAGPGAEREPVKLRAAVQGLGPNFSLTLFVINAAALRPITGLALSLLYDPALYSVAPPLLRLPLLAPGLTYALTARVTCTGHALCDNIKVCVLQEGRSSPLLTANINMPLPEAL
uniref:Uncharacterized protein n=1 Tax=Neogobius melanostomus TaxID=47308 RepID=A0A8C6WSS1_9GOBI